MAPGSVLIKSDTVKKLEKRLKGNHIPPTPLSIERCDHTCGGAFKFCLCQKPHARHDFIAARKIAITKLRGIIGVADSPEEDPDYQRVLAKIMEEQTAEAEVSLGDRLEQPLEDEVARRFGGDQHDTGEEEAVEDEVEDDAVI
eukprot:6209162-Karenia_brevis.AAC.1